MVTPSPSVRSIQIFHMSRLEARWWRPLGTVDRASAESASDWSREQNKWWQETHRSHSSDSSRQIQQVFLSFRYPIAVFWRFVWSVEDDGRCFEMIVEIVQMLKKSEWPQHKNRIETTGTKKLQVVFKGRWNAPAKSTVWLNLVLHHGHLWVQMRNLAALSEA